MNCEIETLTFSCFTETVYIYSEHIILSVILNASKYENINYFHAALPHPITIHMLCISFVSVVIYCTDPCLYILPAF